MDYVTLSILLLIIIPYVYYLYFWLKSRKIQEETADQPTLEDLLNHFIQKISEFEKKIQRFEKLDLSEKQKEKIYELMFQSLYVAFTQEEMQQLLQQVFGVPEISTFQPNEEDVKFAEQQAPVLGLELIKQQLPENALSMLSLVIPDWEKQFLDNPQRAIAVIKMIQNMGLFNLLPGSNKSNTGGSRRVNNGW